MSRSWDVWPLQLAVLQHGATPREMRLRMWRRLSTAGRQQWVRCIVDAWADVIPTEQEWAVLGDVCEQASENGARDAVLEACRQLGDPVVQLWAVLRASGEGRTKVVLEALGTPGGVARYEEVLRRSVEHDPHVAAACGLGLDPACDSAVVGVLDAAVLARVCAGGYQTLSDDPAVVDAALARIITASGDEQWSVAACVTWLRPHGRVGALIDQVIDVDVRDALRAWERTEPWGWAADESEERWAVAMATSARWVRHGDTSTVTTGEFADRLDELEWHTDAVTDVVANPHLTPRQREHAMRMATAEAAFAWLCTNPEASDVELAAAIGRIAVHDDGWPARAAEAYFALDAARRAGVLEELGELQTERLCDAEKRVSADIEALVRVKLTTACEIGAGELLVAWAHEQLGGSPVCWEAFMVMIEHSRMLTLQEIVEAARAV